MKTGVKTQKRQSSGRGKTQMLLQYFESHGNTLLSQNLRVSLSNHPYSHWASPPSGGRSLLKVDSACGSWMSAALVCLGDSRDRDWKESLSMGQGRVTVSLDPFWFPWGISPTVSNADPIARGLCCFKSSSDSLKRCFWAISDQNSERRRNSDSFPASHIDAKNGISIKWLSMSEF